MEDKIRELEEELQATTEELKKILLDIRAFLMEAQNPMRPFERKKAYSGSETGKEVEQHGSREEN